MKMHQFHLWTASFHSKSCICHIDVPTVELVWIIDEQLVMTPGGMWLIADPLATCFFFTLFLFYKSMQEALVEAILGIQKAPQKMGELFLFFFILFFY